MNIINKILERIAQRIAQRRFLKKIKAAGGPYWTEEGQKRIDAIWDINSIIRDDDVLKFGG